MPSRDRLDWLYAFQTRTDWFLTIGGGLQQVTTNLRNPHAQFPSTVLLIGTKEREAAHQALFPGRPHSKSRGLAQVHADDSTSDAKHPLLIASLDTDNACGKQKPPQKHTGHAHHKVMWLSEKTPVIGTESLVETIVGRLLLLFADVVCLFLDDFSTREEGIQFLQRCTRHSSLSPSWKPQVIFVTRNTYKPKNDPNLPTFGGIQHVILPANSRKIPLSRRYLSLKKTMLSDIEMVRNSREASQRLYSAYHLNVFFELALRHVATCTTPPFNFILATRQCNRIEDDLWNHLQSFLELCTVNYVPKEAALEYMASALMLDSFPPGMHRGLIVLMFLLRQNIDECIGTFKQLAERVFLPRQPFGNSLLAKICGFLSSLLTDSLYGAAEMEACVKEAFGADTALFGSTVPDVGISGPKVAVTTMAVSNSRLCILSNYNGAGDRHGYKHYRASDAEDEILVCDAARATSAAPSYFPAKFIRGLGLVQDGGAGKHNNPIDPAEWESKAIWDGDPDLAVSIGTGFAQDPDSPQTVSGRLRLRDRFFPRLLRLFNAMLNAQSGWEDHLNRVHKDERHKYFRINIAMDREPPLDDVGKIPELENLATTFLQGYDFSSITQALFAASFFFELHRKPVARGTSVCSGSIRCRSPDTRALIERILQEYPAASFTTKDGANLGYIGGCSLCAKCGHYRKVVNFKVYHVDQSVSIHMQFNRLGRHRISGFPQSITQFARLQLLDAAFGRADHQIADYAGTSGCQCQVTKKRKRPVPLITRASKRQCLELTTEEN
ncbi:Patatin phospholipase [Pyrenophora tritici-repentis]|uniref:Patatin phospholipase n=2 Tax=Pyrenophora tritici-repentis TaxID=45151 RepID=A0A317AMJ8_9PLEO|nr:Patatin phospholipase [Pyrenophora tritici-repentis]